MQFVEINSISLYEMVLNIVDVIATCVFISNIEPQIKVRTISILKCNYEKKT